MTEFLQRVSVLTEEDYPLVERIRIVEALNEEYYLKYEENLPPRVLNRLGDWLLSDDFKNPASNKVQREEYPILSHHQEKRRNRRRVLIEDEAILSQVSFHLKNSTTIRKEKENEF